MKVIVAGSRTFDNWDLLEEKLNRIFGGIEYLEVCHGNAKGADKLSEWWAFKYRKVVKVFHADWQKHGKAAGPIRNKEMVEYADALVAFWDGNSPGTANIIELAKQAGLQVRVIKYSGSGMGSYYQNTEPHQCSKVKIKIKKKGIKVRYSPKKK